MSEVTSAVTNPSISKGSIPSPCIGICEMLDAPDQCAGCARSTKEIANWRHETDAWRQSVWAEIPGRLKALGVTVQRLQMTSRDILDFVADSIRSAGGTWVLGINGGVGEFTRDQEELFEITRDLHSVTATTSRAALRLNAGPAARLLAFNGKEPGDAPRAYCLAIHKSRAQLPAVNSLTYLGDDAESIRAEDRDASLFDLGLGRDKARFCIRTRDPDLLRALHKAEGLSLTDMLTRIGSTLLEMSPTRVVETSLGRVEVNTSIPNPGEGPQTGPHTHLLPQNLTLGMDGMPGFEVPEAYAFGALFHPRRA